MDSNKPKPIGALWLKTKADGEQYFSGTLENEDGMKVNIVVFANTYKEQEKHPDYRIFRSTKQPLESQTPSVTQATPVADDGEPFPDGPEVNIHVE